VVDQRGGSDGLTIAMRPTMRVCLIVTTLLAATPAFAEPSTTAPWEPANYVIGGIAMGVTEPGGISRVASLEGGLRFGSSGLWIHGEAVAGDAGDDQGSGHVYQGRAGIEGRACWGVRLCGIAGVDLGGYRGTWVKDGGFASGLESETINALVATPRLAGEIGDRLRLRLGIELGLAVFGRSHRQSANGDMDKSVSMPVGAELTLGLGYQW
jgi:hypothetical protein